MAIKMAVFNIFYFLKDLYLEAPVQLGNGSHLLPLEGMSCEDELEIADQLIETKAKLGWAIGQIVSPEKRDAERTRIAHECREAVKLSVLAIPGVVADSREVAYDLTETWSRDIARVLSLIRNVAITIPFWEADDVSDPELKHAAFSFSTRGTDLTYQTGDERQRQLENVMNNVPFSDLLRDQPLLRMALRWYLEAYEERNPDTEFLRFWIALEALAEHSELGEEYSFASEQLNEVGDQLIALGRDAGWDEKVLSNRVNGALSQINRPSIKEKLRALLDAENIEVGETPLGKDIIDALYEARNLIAHYGGLETLPGDIRNSIKNLKGRLGGADPAQLRLELRNLLLPILGRKLMIDIVLE